MKVQFHYFFLSVKSDLEILNLLLDIFRCVDSACITEYLVLSYIEKSFSTVGHFFSYFLMINKLCKLISLNYAIYFRYVQKINIAYVSGLLVYSFMESSILTIIYIFSVFLDFKLHKSSLEKLYIWNYTLYTNLEIIHLISDHLIFLGSVDIQRYLVVTYFER